MSLEEVNSRKERPSFVRFERRSVEDKKASESAGHYVAKDIDYALITAPYSKDVFHIKCDSWFKDLEQQISMQRIPREWVEQYKKQYGAWKNGQELPVSGTPVRGWGVISPAKQETLIAMHILTVEDLAEINDEGVKRIGMGAVELKTKAKAWLAQLNDKGPLTMHVARVERENEVLRSSVETLQKQVATLMEHVKADAPAEVPHETSEITASDLIDDDDIVAQYQAKFGKKPHHKMKPETIREHLK